ncbi:MAG TPA: UvrD-helicase domain-containing protein, partial [Methanotrichaceae archaeon]|nr:UvrD-helicase domain-containing protein [Methanotrichaceae archaeon]
MEQERAKILASRPVDVVEGELSLHHDSEMAGDLAEANRAFLALFRRVHEAYLRDMDRENLTDFAGVLLTLREVLRSRPTLRSRLQDQFRFVIVDEFQDTDFLQKEIIDLLRGPETNVVYVGDAKQSIYRFRGAEVEVFSEARWEVESRSGMVQELDTNYRSHPGVLSFCNRFFPGIFDGDEEGGDRPSAQGYEQVEPLPVEGETGDLPRAKILFHPEDEAKAAALFIKRMAGREFDFLERKADGEGKVLLVASRRRIRYRDFAILLRKLRG